ncbi:hypothetical protein KC19_1G026400 [Ceratodon purpureus]|uniref:Uncharacterized protein n=1 Tax=Ceratodon purpureus TaxID=3225 RepID=A0A8T0J2S5_CERPU|nr:hypothetical protein KC19_1G026400 [Ceratodon purpureus]
MVIDGGIEYCGVLQPHTQLGQHGDALPDHYLPIFSIPAPSSSTSHDAGSISIRAQGPAAAGCVQCVCIMYAVNLPSCLPASRIFLRIWRGSVVQRRCSLGLSPSSSSLGPSSSSSSSSGSTTGPGPGPGPRPGHGHELLLHMMMRRRE